jgi:predicted Fe-S protein YdhL (DUF1289 family)
LPGLAFVYVIKYQASSSRTDSMNAIVNSTPSPCVRNCCLDDELTCLGCFRSLDEIREWGVVDGDRRRVILQNAEQRRRQHQTL